MLLDHFLKLAKTKAAIISRERIHPQAWALLETLAMAEDRGEPLRVTTVMAMTEHGSPATVHRRLAHLRGRGFVGVLDTGGDSRVKQLKLTPAAVALFSELDQSLLTLAEA